MKSNWHVLYYETKHGQYPVREFIDRQTDRNQAKIMAWISMLSDHGPTLSRPYADILSDGIYELRVKLSGDQFRVLYFFCFGNVIVLTHAFVKHTDKVPKVEIIRAKRYRADFLSRFDEHHVRGLLDDDL